MKKPKNKDFISPRDAARTLRLPYSVVLELVRYRIIPAEKIGRLWHIKQEFADTYRSNNQRSISELETEYVSLYWQGLNPEQIQKRVGADIKSRHIVADKEGFAELAIYKSMKRKPATNE